MSSDETPVEPLLALAELGELDAELAREENGPQLARVLDVAQAAVTNLEIFAGGLRRYFADGAAISLARTGHRTTVTVIGAPTSADFAAFITELSEMDQRLLNVATLLGVLLRLCAGGMTAGGAPPLLLKTLADSSTQILQLGAALSRGSETGYVA